jgi:glycosyltransferase involved in cell wall biosynthesis
MTKSKRHILVLSSWYPTASQPFLGNFVERQAKLLSKRYKVTVIALESDSKVSQVVVNITENESIREVRALYPLGSKIKRFFQRRRAFLKAMQVVDDIDLVIGHVLLPHGDFFVKAANHFRAPLIWVEHGSYFNQNSKFHWSKRNRKVLKSVVEQAARIVAVSNTLKNDLSRHIQADHIDIIGNHIDGNLFEFKSKTPLERTRFLHISTLDPNTKNPHGIIEACALLEAENVDFSLTVISDEHYNSWQTIVKQLDLDHRIKFIGPLPWKDLPPYYHNSDAFILNSQYESFSIVAAEALSTGTPLVSTDVGIVSELPATCRIIVQKNNPESLMEAMKRIAEKQDQFNHQEIAALGKAYHEDNILDQWSKLIEQYAK